MNDSQKLEIIVRIIYQAMSRYNNPREKHNIYGGQPRGYIASAMESDLEDGLRYIGVKLPEPPKVIEIDRLF